MFKPMQILRDNIGQSPILFYCFLFFFLSPLWREFLFEVSVCLYRPCRCHLTSVLALHILSHHLTFVVFYSSLRVLVPVQRALQCRRATEHSLHRPPPPIHNPPVPAAKSGRTAAAPAPSGLWTGHFTSSTFYVWDMRVVHELNPLK